MEAKIIEGVRQDCTNMTGYVFGACKYPACKCVDIPAMHLHPVPWTPDPEMQDKIRDKASRGDYD